MKDYSGMGDGEINMLIGESLGLTSYYLNQDESVQFRNEKGHIKGTKDYCNNPADAWPIILENKINIDHRVGFKKPMAKSCTDNSAYATHHNVLRAAMEVFLMMKESEKRDG